MGWKGFCGGLGQGVEEDVTAGKAGGGHVALVFFGRFVHRGDPLSK